MIEQALYGHLTEENDLTAYLATYNGKPAVFNQEAPADRDALWGAGPQYGRLVFAVDIQGDPERTMGGTLVVDIQCAEGEQFPEEIEPIVRELIHGWFFSNGSFTAEAQWKTSSYFTQPTEHVTGCTVSFELLAFPLMTTGEPDVIARINEWTATMAGLSVINYNQLPADAWTPDDAESAVYWRVVEDRPATWIPDTFQTTWRTSTIKCHIFSKDIAAATAVARQLVARLYTEKRLMKDGESPIMVNQQNTVNTGADPLRTGQLTVEATYAIIIFTEPDRNLGNINVGEGEGNEWIPITENP